MTLHIMPLEMWRTGEPIEFEVPGDPVAKGRGRAVNVHGKARIVTPAKTRSWEGICRTYAMNATTGPPLDGPIQLTVRAVFPPASSWPKWKLDLLSRFRLAMCGKPDIDNIVKAVKDALNGVSYRDDSQVIQLIAEKHIAQPGMTAGVQISVRPIAMIASNRKRMPESFTT